MTALANFFVSVRCPQNQVLSGFSLMQADKYVGSTSVFIGPRGTTKLTKYRKSLTVQAGRDSGRLGGASIFIGGFVLGGIVFGTLGTICAPMINEQFGAAETNRKEITRKLPKSIYDEEKALENTHKKLTEKIALLNSAIDEMYVQLRANQNGSVVPSDEVEASF